MIVDLDPMNWRMSEEIIKWCFEHDIDKEKVTKMVEAKADVKQTAMIGETWTLDIPDKYVTYFMLRWL